MGIDRISIVLYFIPIVLLKYESYAWTTSIGMIYILIVIHLLQLIPSSKTLLYFAIKICYPTSLSVIWRCCENSPNRTFSWFYPRFWKIVSRDPLKRPSLGLSFFSVDICCLSFVQSYMLFSKNALSKC